MRSRSCQQFIFLHVWLFARLIEARAMVVDVLPDRPIAELLEFFLGSDAVSAIAAPEHLREGKLFRSVLHLRSCGQHRPYLLEEFLRDDRFMGALVPIITAFRILELTMVERVIQNPIHLGEGDPLIASCFEIRLGVQPFQERPAARASFRNETEELLDRRSADGIDNDFTFVSIQAPLVQVAERRNARADAHLALVLESSFHIDPSVVVLQFRLRAEDHEEKFLVRGIRELLTGRSDFLQDSLIHEINERAKITSVPAETIRCPSHDARKRATPDIRDELAEDRTLPRILC